MKFLNTLLLVALGATTTTLAMPALEAEPNSLSLAERAEALEQRVSCKRVRRFLTDQYGICVDTRKKDSCRGGALYKGLCPGAEYIICCIQ